MKLAMVFPGQGSQSMGMAAGYDAHPVVRRTFAEASEVLGQDVWSLVSDGPVEELNRTVNTQPVMLTADVAVYRAWGEHGGGKASMLAGHSLGEYAALVAAGALSFADALPLVRFRAQAMQDAVPQGVGAMAAVMGLDDAAVAAACDEARQGQVVDPVNFNAPGQVVIAGHKEAVERTIAAAKDLSTVEISAPSTPVLHNVDVRSAVTAQAVRDALARQAANPVRWAETVQAFQASGVTHIVECGPGTVLSGLCRRIAPDIEILPTNDGDALQVAIDATRASEG
ncbi:MAG: ACP S-malonyltransferase [Betaproteobacteria bacterium]|nr:MAG: ACP S-malonyltransferase [Betaproteobacteria bacterium]